MALLFIDVDYFKNYNDQYGHMAGDKCLIKIARTLKTSLSLSTDMAICYGGEEYIVFYLKPERKRQLQLLICC